MTRFAKGDSYEACILATAAFLSTAACATSLARTSSDKFCSATLAIGNPKDIYQPRSATLQDPKGDLVSMVSSRAGEIEKRQSSKVVCVRTDRIRPSSTVTGR